MSNHVPEIRVQQLIAQGLGLEKNLRWADADVRRLVTEALATVQSKGNVMRLAELHDALEPFLRDGEIVQLPDRFPHEALAVVILEELVATEPSWADDWMTAYCCYCNGEERTSGRVDGLYIVHEPRCPWFRATQWVEARKIGTTT